MQLLWQLIIRLFNNEFPNVLNVLMITLIFSKFHLSSCSVSFICEFVLSSVRCCLCSGRSSLCSTNFVLCSTSFVLCSTSFVLCSKSFVLCSTSFALDISRKHEGWAIPDIYARIRAEARFQRHCKGFTESSAVLVFNCLTRACTKLQ